MKNKDLKSHSKEVLNFKEAVALLGISSSMLYKLTHKKSIPHYKPNGKLIYFEKSDLINWMLSNKVSSVNEEEVNLLNHLKERRCRMI
ncbi:helix-turn-helix domain-containing protein [Capnocytophaga sp.]|uniref:helix-turn-helix domain-containing protein n=1 Tax=Capnocytophaga sp. TaxID=44737 RepID=UPI0026DC2EBF|nr:helix-turn-helix domain-containing protein [Capnocytophaga sp.]MDO5106328.1 helix-turn-helix domain-containing protein [Capnocytophaga sp.]